MTDRKFLFQVKKVKKKKMKPIIYIIVEGGFHITDEISDIFNGFVLKRDKAEIDHNPISILKLVRDKWKKQELTNKKGDILICLVNKFFSLYGFKELLKSRIHKDENLDMICQKRIIALSLILKGRKK